jgi:hypothetical protein
MVVDTAMMAVPGSILITGTEFTDDLVYQTPKGDLILLVEKKLTSFDGVNLARDGTLLRVPLTEHAQRSNQKPGLVFRHHVAQSHCRRAPTRDGAQTFELMHR